MRTFRHQSMSSLASANRAFAASICAVSMGHSVDCAFCVDTIHTRWMAPKRPPAVGFPRR